MKVFFALPAYRGVRCPPMLDSFEQAVKLLKNNGHTSQLQMITGSPYLQTARNELVRLFMESDCDLFFSIDDDVSYDPECVLKLVQACENGDEFVSGVYPLKQDNTENWPVVIYTNAEGTPIVRKKDGAIACSHSPGGFICLRRSVVEKMQKYYPEKKYVETYDGITKELYDLWCQGLYNGKWWGEDFAFCELWRKACGIIWLFPDMTFTHWSWNNIEDGESKKWVGNYHEFLISRPKPESKAA